jgi:hypothetical protein
MTLAKAQLTLRRASEESHLFRKTVSMFTERANPLSFDSREGKDMTIALSSANYNDPTFSRLLLHFIQVNPDSMSPEFTQKFLSYAYTMGLEPQNEEETSVFQSSHDIIYK